VVWDGRVVGLKLPIYVEATIDAVGAGSRGDTVSGKTLKDATLTNGRTIRVPLFIDAGERVLVDPTTGEFVRRA
jgi:elongation factor P